MNLLWLIIASLLGSSITILGMAHLFDLMVENATLRCDKISEIRDDCRIVWEVENSTIRQMGLPIK